MANSARNCLFGKESWLCKPAIIRCYPTIGVSKQQRREKFLTTKVENEISKQYRSRRILGASVR